MNVPAYSARNKTIGSSGMTVDVNADSVQIAAITDFTNALPDAATLADLPGRTDDLEADIVTAENEIFALDNRLTAVENSGPGYTDAQARAAQLNRTAASGASTVTLTAEAPTDYGTAPNGTFTVDGTGAEVGKVVRFALSSAATAPSFTNAPAGKPYKQLGATWLSGHAYTYSLLVSADVIEVVCLLND
jgi:hypothetical protein